MISYAAYGQELRCHDTTIGATEAVGMLHEIPWDFQAERLERRLNESLTDIEKVKIAHYYAIHLYTDHMYKYINPVLRDGDLFDAYSDFIHALCSGLNVLPNYEGEVIRVVNLPNDVLDSYQVNSIVTEKAFMSSSADKTGTDVFRTNTDKQYNTIFYIYSFSGKDISQISKWPNEKEILFRAGTNFRVTNRVDPYFFSKTTYIWLEETLD